MMMEIISRHIKRQTECELWARSAGRCQFNGCNRLLYKSPVTQERVNISEKAHIYSFAKSGPRGRESLSENKEQINNIDNLILVCHDCHKTIDQDKIGKKYSVNLLQNWKKNHEHRVVITTGITPDKKSHVVFYTSKIGEQTSIIEKADAHEALFAAERYPTHENPVHLSMSCSHEDNSSEFWRTESNHLCREFERSINPLIKENNPGHFSLFALAPIPLLIQLGTLFTDKISVDVRQLMREPKTWKWQEFPESFKFKVNAPNNFIGKPALLISLSGQIESSRVTSILGENISIWELTVSNRFLHNDSIRSQMQLSLFKTAVRRLMVLIMQKHGNTTPLHVFPAMPVSCAIEMGRTKMLKADMPWIIYDQNKKKQKFIKTLTV